MTEKNLADMSPEERDVRKGAMLEVCLKAEQLSVQHLDTLESPEHEAADNHGLYICSKLRTWCEERRRL